jgi:hypothetical protein
MSDLRNKYRKEQQVEVTRRRQGRHAMPKGQPFEPACAGCGLKDFNNPSPKGFGVIRFYLVSGAWQEPDKFYCEDCLEAHTGKRPHGD